VVHAANMAKRNPATGKFEKRADGKIIKPPGWKAPDVEGEMGRQFREGSWPSAAASSPATPQSARQAPASPVFDASSPLGKTSDPTGVAKQLGSKLETVSVPAKTRPKVGVGVIVLSDEHPGCILLGKRLGSAGAGMWALPGGHVEFGEQLEECAAREVLEETGLVLEQLSVATTVNCIREEHDYHYVVPFVTGQARRGAVVKNLEPDKCEGWEWVPWAEDATDVWAQPVFRALPAASTLRPALFLTRAGLLLLRRRAVGRSVRVNVFFAN